MIPTENKPLAPFTTFSIGGPARWFVEATSEDEIIEAAAWARQHSLPLLVLGGGSNLLVADAGFNGLTLRIALRGIKAAAAADNPSQKIYQVAAGEDWDAFVERAVGNNCAGVECLAGIPGTVGGTPVQNVGAYGQEVSTAIEQVRAYDLQAQKIVEFPAADCGFAYRRSRFNSTDRGRYIVTRVDYRLTPSGAPTLGYPELQRAILAGRSSGSQPTLAEVAAVVRRVRQTKGMLLVDGAPDCRSAGSFFKNPVVSVAQAENISAISGKQPPSFPAAEGMIKLPAAWLIEQAGFPKGYTLHAAGISSRHTLALINRGTATAAEILALAEQIVAAVDARFGVRLEMEPVLVGFR